MISLISTGGNLLCRLLGPSTNTLFVRSSCVRACLVHAAKSFSSGSDGPPKVPATGYIRFVKQQQTVVAKQYPDVKYVEITKKIAQQWHALTPEQKLPFEQAAQAAREQYKEELKQFHARLTPEQSKALLEMKRQKRVRRKAIRMKRELTMLGKPKRPRTAFNIFMSEHFVEAKGVTMQGKMKSLVDDWAKLDVSLKKTYKQLAEDDRVRYVHEMESWEKYMAQIGREDLVRRKGTLRKAVGAKGAARGTKDKAVQTDATSQNITKSTARLKKPEE
ncbi:transcription factor A, mitochondrial-like [Anguilla anguilla]|uniref:transcription factor A, mitochondrial-like n=1 Tax=Anguilla anguilla TaxID=7936 RepID=UPI0015ACAB56|nr:transcription factor A, mitochondrial-like [Anguilla anguilla]